MPDHLTAAPMKPLATLAWGLLLVLLDFRVDGLDVLPDPVGWGVAAFAAGSLPRSMRPVEAGARSFRVAAWACAAAVLPAAPDWLGARLTVITLLVSVAATVTVFATCTGIMAVLPARRSTANVVRWTDLGTAAGVAVLTGAAQAAPSLAPLALLTGLGGLVVFAWFLVLLFRAAKDSAAPQTP